MTTLVDKLLVNNLKALKPYESARRLFSSANADGEVATVVDAGEVRDEIPKV